MLKGLNKRAGERLIQQVVGKDVAPSVVAWIIEQAAGNALYLEELIRAAAEGKREGRSEIVLAMLRARISRLPFLARRLMHGASIFGLTFWKGGVAELLGCNPASSELAQSLIQLIGAELISRREGGEITDEQEYGSRHALMRDAALCSDT